jgi:hypothetical protein
MLVKRIGVGGGSASKRLSREAAPPPVRIRVSTELPSPARGEGDYGAGERAAARAIATILATFTGRAAGAPVVQARARGDRHCIPVGACGYVAEIIVLARA